MYPPRVTIRSLMVAVAVTALALSTWYAVAWIRGYCPMVMRGRVARPRASCRRTTDRLNANSPRP